MNASDIKVPRGVTVTQKFHPALGLRRVSEPKPEPPIVRPTFHMVLGISKPSNPNRNVWGTDIELIDAKEYCVDCEHAIPGHYDNCDHAGRGR